MMSLKLLPIFVIMLATVSSISFGMEAPKTITILYKDGPKELDNTERTEDKLGLGDILATSHTIKSMFGDLGEEKQLKSGSKLTINQPISFLAHGRRRKQPSRSEFPSTKSAK